MNIYSLLMGLFSFGILLIGFFCCWRCRASYAMNFLIFSIVTAGWSGLWAIWSTQQFEIKETLFLIKLGYLFAVFIPVTFFHFVVTFLNIEKFSKNFFYCIYTLTAFLTPVIVGDSFVPGLQAIPELKFFPLPGPAFFLFAIDFLVLVFASFYFLIKSSVNAEGKERERLKYLTATSLLCFMCGGLTFLPVYKIYFPLAIIAPMPLYPFLLGMALMRFDLFNVEEIAQAARRDKLAAIGTLATSINHEIRNPLFIIQGLSDSHLSNVEQGIYLNREQAFEKSNLILQKISHQATRAMDIMGRFAVFAKKNVSSPLNNSKCNIYNVLESIIPLINYELELEKINLTVEIDRDCTIKADSRHIEEILFNLIVNACQAIKSAQGSGKIRVFAQSCEKDVILSVADDGPGISQEEQKKIFDPFFTTKEKGTGLGLYVVKQLVEQNGGTIKVSSQISLGTTFKVSFRNAFSIPSTSTPVLSRV